MGHDDVRITDRLRGAPVGPNVGLNILARAEFRHRLFLFGVVAGQAIQRKPFVSEGGLVKLDAHRYAALAPLASLAECGKTGCACTRTLYPAVRQRLMY